MLSAANLLGTLRVKAVLKKMDHNSKAVLTEDFTPYKSITYSTEKVAIHLSFKNFSHKAKMQNYKHEPSQNSFTQHIVFVTIYISKQKAH